MKDNRGTVIRFDYGGYYFKNGDDIRWNRKEDQVYTLVMKESLEEFTYSGLVNRICRKLMLDEGTTMLKLSYIPLLEDPKRQTYILDDEDVLGYLMEGNKNLRRNILHVELIELVEQNQSCEQLSREDRRSGIDVRNENGSDSRVNDGDAEFEPLEQYAVLDNGPRISNGEDDPCDQVAYEDNCGMSVDVDNTPSIQAEEVVNLEWEDGIGLNLGQEFESKQAVQDLVEKAVLRKVATFKSSTALYVLKCCDSCCKWSLRVAKLKKSDRFSVRTYNNMHTCSRVTTSRRSNKRIGTPRLVASVLHEDYLTPKNLISLVEERYGVKVLYSTALRGKKQAAHNVQGNLHIQ